jgi:hypothetical protein
VVIKIIILGGRGGLEIITAVEVDRKLAPEHMNTLSETGLTAPETKRTHCGRLCCIANCGPGTQNRDCSLHLRYFGISGFFCSYGKSKKKSNAIPITGLGGL